MAEPRDRDLVLAPGEFAYVLDTTKGLVNVNVGPYKTSMAGTDQPVVWDKEALRFIRCELEAAIQRDRVAPEGFYLALYNPATAEREQHPGQGKSSVSVELNVGHRVNIPGPAHFALWPGQMAEVIRGHHLRSNQYLLAQVYNDAEATENWQRAVVKPQGESATPITPRAFTPGQLMVIKGTDVAFFMPPTGIKVVPETRDHLDVYVREAVTLERLEYCILLDENGNKRFVPGPAVVFPEPTEHFIVKDTERKFRAIELNETTGIYVKVIAEYEDSSGKHKAGDELFITGKEQAIYFQREEHSIIRYGDQTKHYAVAIPAGEGRYVLNRRTGVITLQRGPQMLLCDPRTEVIVRRVLSQKAAKLYYPGNDAVLKINRDLETQMAATSGSAYEPGRVMTTSLTTAGLPTTALGVSNYAALNFSDEVAAASRQIAGDTFARGNKFTPPRTITLDTKYEGAISVTVWTGYAVMVIKKTGARRVVVGPETLLLEYDETLAPLSLSTGRPKSRDKVFETVYLRVGNNTVSDIVRVETADLVPANVLLSYRVNFEGAPEQWFAVENYIGLLGDHMRSLIRNAVKRKGIEEFYANAIDIIRDTLLGKSAEGARTGRLFAENGMRVYDVEVLSVDIDNPAVAALLNQVQVKALQSAIQIAEEERGLQVTLRSEDIKRQSAAAKTQTVEETAALSGRELTAAVAVALAKVGNDARVETEKLTREQERQATKTALSEAELGRRQALANHEQAIRQAQVELELKRIVGETEEIAKRAHAVSPNLATALLAFSDQELVQKIATALGPMAAMNGVSAADILAKLFHGTAFEGVMTQLGTRSRIPVGSTEP